jgi:hypothetical protein
LSDQASQQNFVLDHQDGETIRRMWELAVKASFLSAKRRLGSDAVSG